MATAELSTAAAAPSAGSPPAAPSGAESVISPQALTSSLLSLINSSPDPIVFVESSDHTLLALPLPIARRCHAIITKHLHADLTAHGTALFTTVTGEAMVRCIGYIQHEWKEIERRKEKLAVLMRLRGQKGSERSNASGDGDKEGGGRRGKDREKNLLASVQKAQQQLVAYFGSLTHLSPPTSGAPASGPQFPPHALGVAAPSTAIASLLAPSSTVAHNPQLSYSINHILCELASCAYYLEVPPLVDLTCQRLADSIQGKSPEEIRTTFNITNDFTPTEEEQVKQRVVERTLLYPGGIDDTLPGQVEGEEGGRGLMAGLSAGLGGGLGVREKLKVKLAEKRMLQMKGAAGVEEKKEAAVSVVAPTVKAEETAGVAAGGGSAGGSAAKKKKKKKAKKKGNKAADGDDDKDDTASSTSAAMLNESGGGDADHNGTHDEDDHDTPAVDGGTYQLLKHMASSLSSTASSLPAPAASAAPVVSHVAVTASTPSEQTTADPSFAALIARSSSDRPRFPVRTHPDPSWLTLRLLFSSAVGSFGLAIIHTYMPLACYIYTGLTLSSETPSSLVHVCFETESVMMETAHSALFHQLLPALRAPPTVILDMWDMWSTGRLMRCCNLCGMAGHLGSSPSCPLTQPAASPAILDPTTATPAGASQLITLRLLFRLALTPPLLPYLQRLLPQSLFLHLGFHPLYSTPTHMLHVTLSSSAAMEQCLLRDVPSIIHLMHSPPRIELMDVSQASVLDACDQCGQDGRHGGRLCPVAAESKGCELLSVAMLPPASFSSLLPSSSSTSSSPGSPATPSSMSSSSPMFAALGRIIDSGSSPVISSPVITPSLTTSPSSQRRKRKAESMTGAEDGAADGDDTGPARKDSEEVKEAAVTDSGSRETGEREEKARVEEKGSEDEDDSAEDSCSLRELIDAKLSGLQQWEQHHGQHEDDTKAAVGGDALSAFFCYCAALTSPPIPLSSSMMMSDLSRCPFSPVLLNTMALCSHCGLLVSAASPSSSFPPSSAAINADLRALLMDTDPALLAALPYSFSSMLRRAAGVDAGVKAEDEVKGGRHDGHDSADDDIESGIRSIQLHSLQLPSLLHPSSDISQPATAKDDAPAHAGTTSAVMIRAHSEPAVTKADSALPVVADSTPVSSADSSTHSHRITPVAVPATTTAVSAPSSSCPQCAQYQSSISELSSLSKKLSRLVDEQSKRITALEATLRKHEASTKRTSALEDRIRALERMDERVKTLEKDGDKRKEDVKRVEKRVADEEKRRADMERWVEEEAREKGARGERERERREGEDKRERAEWKRMQAKWAETDKERERQWSEWTARWERDREKERAEREAKEKALRTELREEERRGAAEREGRVLSQLQLHSDVLVRVDRKLQALEQMVITSDSVISRQRIVEIVGFDPGDQ